MTDSFNRFAAEHKPLINNWLAGHFAATAHPDASASYLDLLAELTALTARGGKRLRPLLALLAYEGYGGKDRSAIVPIASATELLHTFLLIHDDIIDRDSFRWGGPNIIGIYFERYSDHKPPREALHYAQSQALLAGDICQNLATDAIVNAPFASGVVMQLQRLFGKVTREVLDGELDDISFSHVEPSSEQILAMYHHKTASYSFILPLQVGAIAAGASSEELNLLHSLGKDIGLAYQLQDDLLGVFGDSQRTGKSNLSDIREGKRTYLMATALQVADAPTRKKLMSMLGNSEFSSGDLIVARQLITACGARTTIEDMIHDVTQQGLKLLKTTKLNDSTKRLLADGIESLITRKS